MAGGVIRLQCCTAGDLCVRRQLQRRGRTSKMSMEGWWMVHTTVRPVLTVLRTAGQTDVLS